MASACLVVLFAFAPEKPAVWTVSCIEMLFPDPASGWTQSDLELDRAVSVTNKFAPAVAGRTRLRAARHYESDGRRFSITIDTRNVEAAVQISGIVAGDQSGGQLQDRIRASGVVVTERDGFSGLISLDKGGAAWTYKVGAAAIVLIKCHYRRCADDVQATVGDLNLKAIEDFAAFDHAATDHELPLAVSERRDNDANK